MSRRRATLQGMNSEGRARMLAFVCDVIDQQAGDWDATETALRDQYTGEDLDQALVYGMTLLIVYAEPGGPAFVRGMRDRRRRLVPAQPAGAPGRRLWGR